MDGAEGVIVVIDGFGAAEGVAAIIAAVAALPAQVPLLLLVNKIDARGRSPQLAASLGPRPEFVRSFHTRHYSSTAVSRGHGGRLTGVPTRAVAQLIGAGTLARP